MAKKSKKAEIKVESVSPASPGDMEWKAKDALDTILRAEEYKQDQDLMGHVRKLAGKKEKAIRSVSDLRDAANEAEDREENMEYEMDRKHAEKSAKKGK